MFGLGVGRARLPSPCRGRGRNRVSESFLAYDRGAANNPERVALFRIENESPSRARSEAPSVKLGFLRALWALG